MKEPIGKPFTGAWINEQPKVIYYDIEDGKNICPYCKTEIDDLETYVDDHEECFPC